MAHAHQGASPQGGLDPVLQRYIQEQRRMIRNAFSAWRDMAEDAMLTRYPELLRTQTRQRLEAVTQ